MVLALKPVDNETFYREVDEELRRDQMRSYWERFGKLAIAGVVLFIVALGGAIWWMNQREIRAGAQGETLASLFEDVSAGNRAAAKPKLDQLAASGTRGYRVAALLVQADMASDGNDKGRAIALFKQVADDSSLPAPYRDLALLRMSALQYDALPPQVLIDRLKPLAVPGGPWFGSAGEMVAGSYLKLGRPQEAGRMFAAIARDHKAPESIRGRSMQMASSLGFDAIQDSDTGRH
jgi:hypothetical protein